MFPLLTLLPPSAFASVVGGLGKRERQTQLHVFSLADFHQAVGPKWERLSGLVEIAVDRIISRHIDPAKDIYTQLDAETACLVLPRDSRKQVRARVAAIAHDLSAYLFGDVVIEGRRPRLVAANLPVSRAIPRKGEVGDVAIRGAIAEAGAVLAEADARVDPDRAPLAEIHRVTLASMLDGASAVPAISATSVPAMSQTGGAAMGPGAGVLDWMDEQIDARAAAALAKARRLAPESCLTLVWTPTWVTRMQAVAAFHARVIRVDGETAPTLEGVQAYRDAAPLEALAIDRFAATQAAAEMKMLFHRRQSVGLTLPLHWMSLAPRWRDCIRLPLEGCPADIRRKLLKVEIFGLPPRIPAATLASLTGCLDKVGCDVMIRLPLASPDMALSLPPVRAIGVDLAELPDDERVGDDELLAHLRRFHDMARQINAASYVWGVRRRSLVARIIGAGFSLVNGPGVMEDVGHPRPAG